MANRTRSIVVAAFCAAGWAAGLGAAGCGVPLPNQHTEATSNGFELVARIVHISDSQIVDEESPARFTTLADLNAFAWRPQERFSCQLLDGTIRAINVLHERYAPVDFAVFTGDAVDNSQHNELKWFIDILDGRTINPLTGIDDRPDDMREPFELDAHRTFRAVGLYRNGIHGELPTIPWYTVVGNHDRYASGVFPILRNRDGELFSPVPLPLRLGLFLPTVLEPHGNQAFGPVTPLNPGPPRDLSLAVQIPSNYNRRYFTNAEFIDAHFDTVTGPSGHGFANNTQSWYSVSPVPGLRLIGLDSSIPAVTIPTGIYFDGAIVTEQARFLREELDKALAADEIVVVATHHPSESLLTFLGTSLRPEPFRRLLNSYPNVAAHLSGHTHRNRVWNRGGYIEFETSAIIDFPQESRIVEIYRRGEEIELRYSMFSHLYRGWAFDQFGLRPTAVGDEMLDMRFLAAQLAQEHASRFFLLPPDPDLLPVTLRPTPASFDAVGLPIDRDGTVRLER